MIKRTAIPAALLAAIGLVAGAPAPTDAAVSDAVIIALNSIEIDRNATLTGDIVVNAPNAAANHPLSGADLDVDKVNSITGDLYAESMKLSKGAVIVGDLFVDDLTDQGATYGTPVNDYVPPVFEPLPAFRPAVPGSGAGANCDPGADCFIAQGDEQILPPGAYGAITMAPYARLVLTGGGYDVASVLPVTGTGGPCGSPCRQIEFQAVSQLRVAGRFDLESNSRIAPDGAGLSGQDLVIYVGGTNADPADPRSRPAAAQLGKLSEAHANFYVEAGTFHLDRGSTLTGAVIALDAQISRDSTLDLDSAFNFAPVANPQTVTTSGGTVSFNLTATDVDGDELTFTLDPLSGPSGTLIGLPQSDFANPTASVTVTYTGTDGVTDAFVFMVDDGKGGTDTAVVDINPTESCDDDSDCPTGFVCNTDDPDDHFCEVEDPDGILAKDDSYETVIDTPVDLILSAAAPDGTGDLVFSIISGPSPGSLSPLVQGSGSPRRTATTTYTPSSGFSGPDSFVFEACDTFLTCDQAEIEISVEALTPVAPPVANDLTATSSGGPVVINLTGGGTSTSAPPEGRSCEDSTDCAAGFDCIAGACVEQ